MLHIDYEHEAQKDYIYALERQKDLEASWQEEEFRKPAKIIVNYETKHKSITFRRVAKKILLSRSHLFAESH
jgi:hypothetical protein